MGRGQAVKQPLAGVAREFGQPFLDVQVDVLEVDRPDELAAIDFAPDPFHAGANRGQVFGGQDADRVQHRRVSQRAVDVGGGQALVEADRGGIALDELADRLGEAGRPGLGFPGKLICHNCFDKEKGTTKEGTSKEEWARGDHPSTIIRSGLSGQPSEEDR